MIDHPAVLYFCRMKYHTSYPLLSFSRTLPVYFLLTAVHFSCGNQAAEETAAGVQIASDSSVYRSVDEFIAAWPEAGSVSGDTLNIHGKFVIIMGPETGSEPESEAFFLALMDTLKGNFEANTELTFLYSGARYIRIFIRETGKSMVVDRATFDRKPGVMVTDGLQPSKMKNGIFTAEEFSALIREYFFIPS